MPETEPLGLAQLVHETPVPFRGRAPSSSGAQAAKPFIRFADDEVARGLVPPMTLNLARRFLAKVKITRRCWVWQGWQTDNGYGRIQIEGRRYRAHRVAYEWEKGPVGEDLVLLHKCDNRLCVRPSHLSAGTHQENVADCVTKDRHPRGSRHGASKLTERKVRNIRRLYGDGVRPAELANRYKVSPSLIQRIVAVTVWRHVRHK